MHFAHTTALQCNLSGCDNIPLHIGRVSKSMTESTCPFYDTQPLEVNGVNMVKQGIRCDAWLSPWFLFMYVL